jgi:AcrR family transcriptional regulator
MPTTAAPLDTDVKPAARVRLRRGEGDRLREEVLDAAETLMVDSSSADAVSIRAISQIVGVTAPSIYRHFADRNALVLAACERAYSRFDQYIDKAAADATDPLHDIKSRALAYVRWALDNPGQYRVLFMLPGTHSHDEETANDSFDPVKSHIQGLQQLDRALAGAVAQGLIHPSGPTMELATLLWSMVHGIASIRIAQPDFPWPDVEKTVGDMFQILAIGMCTEAARERLVAKPTKSRRKK